MFTNATNDILQMLMDLMTFTSKCPRYGFTFHPKMCLVVTSNVSEPLWPKEIDAVFFSLTYQKSKWPLIFVLINTDKNVMKETSVYQSPL